MGDLVAWLRAQLDQDEQSIRTKAAGHPGPCLNYAGQDPDTFDDYDSCYRHLAAAEATPYSDTSFGLAEVEARRRILDLWETADGSRYDLPLGVSEGRDPDERERDDVVAETLDDVLRLLALPYADRSGYDEAWKP